MYRNRVSRRWFTETDVKHFKSGVWCIANNHKYNQE